jgi:hypothetical protein
MVDLQIGEYKAKMNIGIPVLVVGLIPMLSLIQMVYLLSGVSVQFEQ